MTGTLQPATPPDPVLWRGLRRAALDAGYNNSAAVADSADKLEDWSRRSAQLRARQPDHLDLAYGPRERNKFDIFRSGPSGAPLFVFIHGGYWQRNAKEIFSCMAEGPLAAGVDAALVGYTLAPEATLEEIVSEIRAALQWLRREGPAIGVATGPAGRRADIWRQRRCHGLKWMRASPSPAFSTSNPSASAR